MRTTSTIIVSPAPAIIPIVMISIGIGCVEVVCEVVVSFVVDVGVVVSDSTRMSPIAILGAHPFMEYPTLIS